MIEILLMRHAQTEGNIKKQYIGSTDLDITPEGEARARALRLPQVDTAYVSPLLRCRRTASLAFPGARQVMVDGLRECDFGEFEGKSYLDLQGDARYQAWIDSGGTLAFPGGESLLSFSERCGAAFASLVDILPDGARTAVVAHGGTVMAVMWRFARPERPYYDWQVGNLGGFALRIDPHQWLAERTFTGYAPLIGDGNT